MNPIPFGADRPRISPEVRHSAAAWLTRRDAGLTAVEEAEFAQWLGRDELHRIAFAEISGTWSALNRLQIAQLPVDGVNPDLLAPRRPSWKVLLPAIAAAAALVVGYFGWWNSPRSAFYTQTVATTVDGLQRMDLPDGSVVLLNTDTSVKVAFTTTERRVLLVRGEAHFEVAKYPNRPFIVSAGRVAVRAVGTAFNVRMDPSKIEVLVTEGQVRLDDAIKGESLLAKAAPASPRKPSEEVPVLSAGQRAVVSLTAVTEAAAPAAVAPVAPEEALRALAWQGHRFEFVSAPLADVVSELNRHNRHKLVIADPRLNSIRFGGIFSRDGSDALVRLLESNFGVTAERRESETFLRKSP